MEGINEITAVELISEIGTDMTKWRSTRHLAGWMNLAPNTRITGGKIISSKMQRKKNHSGQTLRMAASTLSRSRSPMGDFSRKMRARLGKKGGVVATAHKMLRIIYTMIKEKVPYDKGRMIKNQEKWREKRIHYLEKQIRQLQKSA